MRAPGLVLASTSPYRRELLARLGVPFESLAPDFDEARPDGRSVSSEEAGRIARGHAAGKARSLEKRCPGRLVLASDQVCECAGRVLGKAGDAARAEAQLRFLAGREHRLHTAVVLLDTRSGERREEVVVTTVHFRALSDPEIEFYVRRETPFDSAGGYYSERLGVALFESVVTADPTAIIGLPLIATVSLLASVGLDVLRPETWPISGRDGEDDAARPGTEGAVRSAQTDGEGA